MKLEPFNQASRTLEVPENYLRMLHKRNELPGVYTGEKGGKFLVEVDAAREMLAKRAVETMAQKN